MIQFRVCFSVSWTFSLTWPAPDDLPAPPPPPSGQDAEGADAAAHGRQDHQQEQEPQHVGQQLENPGKKSIMSQALRITFDVLIPCTLTSFNLCLSPFLTELMQGKKLKCTEAFHFTLDNDRTGQPNEIFFVQSRRLCEGRGKLFGRERRSTSCSPQADKVG